MTRETIRTGHLDNRVSLEIDREDWNKVRRRVAKLLQAEQRVEGIVTMCTLDDALEGLLRAAMIDDKSVVKELMKDDRLLGSFSSKLKLAYALGLIPDTIKKDLDCLNKIRNAFAHEANVAAFDKAPVRDLCKNLSTAKLRSPEPLPLREAHRQAVISTSLYLEYETERRVKQGSPQPPPVDWMHSMFLAKGDQKNEEPK